MDNELLRVWLLVHELSDQLAQNQKFTVALQSQADILREQASHSGTGFALRRFNTDISKEVFESELERMNAQVIIENQTLLHENKQLSLLLKEYETTMETIMAKFRNHALAAQQHELTLTRHYETLLQARETQTFQSDLSSESAISVTLQRLSQHLRNLLRTMQGEEPELVDENSEDQPEDLQALLDALHEEAGVVTRDDWALERECEISRLEKENEELRKLLGIDPTTLNDNGVTLDPERDDSTRYSTLLSRKRSESIRSGGMVFAEPPNAWGQSMPMYGPDGGNETGTNGNGMFQQQHQLGNGVPLQRVVDIPAATMRIQPRRPPMFTRNSGPSPAINMNPGRGTTFFSQVPQQIMFERPWSQTGSTPELSR